MRASVRFLLTLMVVVIPALVSGQGVDVIRGRVTGAERQPLEGVEVIVTTLSGAVSRTARTDRNGRYMITFPGGDGDYFVSFRAIGFAPRRYQIKRMADEDMLVADTRLERTATTLGEVRVTAPRDRPTRGDPSQDIAGTERTAPPGSLPPDQQGDLAAMAAATPGALMVPGQDGDPSGFSVLGLGTDQNNTTLNGQNFGANDLPRDAMIGGSLNSSPFDVSRGGFSGANFNLRSRPGSNFKMRTSSLNLDAPGLQWTDAAARALGQEFSNASLGGLVSGPIRYNAAFYNMAWQLGRRSSDLQTLMNTNPGGLAAAGVSADSATRLLGILGTLGVPATTSQVPSSRLADRGSVFGGIDVAPPSSRSGASWGLNFNGSWNRFNPLGGQVLELPGHSGSRTNWNAGAQLRHSTYFGFGALSETSVNVGYNDATSAPFLALPTGAVRITSALDDGTNGVKTVTFGGGTFLDTRTTSASAGALNQLSWFSENNAHRVKLTSELRYDGYDARLGGNLLGSWFYNSLADLEAGRPGSYTRQLGQRTRESGQVTGALSLGDSWRLTPRVQVQYGLRLDGNRFLVRPDSNSQVDVFFGARNSAVPNGLYVSPRVGFSWAYGQAAQVGGFEGAFRGPRAVVRGGVGVFQGTPGTQVIGSALDNTGLPTGVQLLNCVGIAVPDPSWSRYLADRSQIPSQCADGTSGSVFANSRPNISYFSDEFAAPRSLRSTLSWSGPVVGNRLNASIEGTWSRNINQQGFVDRNFSLAGPFPLTSEGGRPVFVAPGSIDPNTGLIAAGGARQYSAFNRVTEQRSDLKSESRMVRTSFSPLSFNTRYNWSLTYVYQNVRERVRGFGNNTAGDPWAVEWARGNFDARHQVQYSLYANLFDLLRVNWFGNVRSGLPYTPLVAGDVNGDGYQNDRAMVFDPATAGDAALTTGMQELLASASGSVRDCLQTQLGRVASRNSCNGPWTHSANLSLSFNPLKVRMPQRATLSFNVSNPLGAADLLLHGNDNLRGWGQTPIPDATLLAVRGFDATNRRYRYDVNRRFGATNPAFSAFRMPVTVTAMVRFDVGPTRERQNLAQQLNVGRSVDGNKMPEPMLRAIYSTGGLINPVASILRQTDTLQLTVAQADSLATLNRWFLVRTDSIWTPIAKELAALPDHYDEGDAYARYRAGRERTVDLMKRLATNVRGLLTPAQRRKLPSLIQSYLDPRYLASIRSGTAGSGAQGFFPGAGGPIALPAGGGGQAITIVR